jgi:hypothetical protein
MKLKLALKKSEMGIILKHNYIQKYPNLRRELVFNMEKIYLFYF